ncbi:autophagy protein 16 [Aulographum hederae CBS 113979]|uniref:Autophagy protein 16 n=1 Tax=Aulographum hederae CBS 113979 TaxID=1176131 RepID=A0A6G1GSZ9_9PEZI|nr:autophagy protein 16 [Aulographum hederae CBS 113979]
MKSWISEYSSALSARDVRDKAQASYIDAYTTLADRTARLEIAPPPAPPSPSPQPTASSIPNSPDDASLTRLRADLATTQKSRADLSAQVTTLNSTLATLQKSASTSSKQITSLQRQVLLLERKLSDRTSELAESKKLVEGVQDEMIGMNLELGEAGKKMEGLRAENKRLVERWIVEMGERARRMNEEVEGHAMGKER